MTLNSVLSGELSLAKAQAMFPKSYGMNSSIRAIAVEEIEAISGRSLYTTVAKDHAVFDKS